MPDLLKTIQKKGKRTKPRRTLIYGTHGIGKSTFASCMPVPLILDLEDGLEDIECQATPKIDSFEEFMGWIAELYEEKHAFKTVAVDTLDFLERMIWKSLCAQEKKATIDDFGFGRGYKMALQIWQEVLGGLDALRDHREVSILLLAHSHTEKFDNPDTEAYDRYSPRLHKAASQLIQQWCDEVLFATYKIYTVKDDQGFGRERTRAMGGQERVLRTVERAAHLAKNRIGMPEEIELAWKTYNEHLNPNTKEKEKKTSGQSG